GAWQGECYGDAALQGGVMCAGGPCNTSATMAAPVAIGGNCPASGGVSDQQPAQWEAFGLGCSTTVKGAGCGAGNVCQPKSATPFRTGLCVYKLGENSCPVGPFSQQFVYFEKADDTRSCTACTCEAPMNSTCSATVHIYSDLAVNTCNTEIASFNAGSCTPLTGNPTAFGRSATVTGPTGGSCNVTAGGGNAMGSLTPVNPTTFCCVP
ncbi:MAG TPA: hypothetical protein PK156_40625, partial [Polyangium sp.]|nr:hypothetical protein [Polyangium sp.]